MATRDFVVDLTGLDEAIRKFLSEHPAELGRVRKVGDAVSVRITIPESLLEELRQLPIRTEILYDATARGKARLEEVDRTTRFSPGKPPRGLGVKLR